MFPPIIVLCLHLNRKVPRLKSKVTSLEERQGMLHGDQTISFTVDEKSRTGDVGNHITSSAKVVAVSFARWFLMI